MNNEGKTVKEQIDEWREQNPGASIAAAARALNLRYNAYFKEPTTRQYRPRQTTAPRVQTITAMPLPNSRDKVVAFVGDPLTLRRMFDL